MSYNPYNMNVCKCECGNNFTPSGKEVCPPCHKTAQLHRFTVRTELRLAKRMSKKLEREKQRTARNTARTKKIYVNK